MTKLQKYKEKRDFKSTPEPKSGKSKEQGLIFTVQKHAARRLHYDLRLEVNGVLKSWAVPKGPSMDPSEKHLAIMVEDHPLDYATFEGIIPKGNYGAGTVMVWDTGTYTSPHATSKKETEKSIEEGIKKGHIDFVLSGKKLKGGFSLIKLKQADKDNAWLLIKRKDDAKQPKGNVERSVLTKRSMQEIAGKSESDLLKGVPRETMPHHIHPMLGSLIDQPFDKKGWIFEIKWDGYRGIAEIKKNKVLLYSRNDKSFNQQFPLIVEDLERLKINAVLDGEIVILDKSGKPQFQLLQNYQTTRRGAPYFYVFDILHLNGHDLRGLPLTQRKEILKTVLAPFSESRIRYSDHVEERGKAFFKIASKKNLEGIMAKDGSSTYVMRRSSSWLKIKTHLRQEVVIGGFTQPRGSRKKFGALVVGVYEAGELVYVSHVGGGFTQKLLDEVYKMMQPLITKKCPFKKVPKANQAVTWIKPKLVCEVSFAEWTSEGQMRQPIFKGIRIDKKPREVKREIP